MNSNKWFDPTITYVGRTRYALGLGNPWGKKIANQVRFFADSKEQALNEYRYWLLGKIIPEVISPTYQLEDWEKIYLDKVKRLAREIWSERCTELGCWCVSIYDYEPVPEGNEKCHAEILYKGCLRLIEFWKNKDLQIGT